LWIVIGKRKVYEEDFDVFRGKPGRNIDGHRLTGYGADYGAPGYFQVCSAHFVILVGGNYTVFVYMVCLYQCQLMYKKMYFH
jgi:hypothetical protein